MWLLSYIVVHMILVWVRIAGEALFMWFVRFEVIHMMDFKAFKVFKDFKGESCEGRFRKDVTWYLWGLFHVKGLWLAISHERSKGDFMWDGDFDEGHII